MFKKLTNVPYTIIVSGRQKSSIIINNNECKQKIYLKID